MAFHRASFQESLLTKWPAWECPHVAGPPMPIIQYNTTSERETRRQVLYVQNAFAVEMSRIIIAVAFAFVALSAVSATETQVGDLVLF